MSQQTANFYNRFSFFYPLVDFFLKGHKSKLLREINKEPAGKLLEIGIGNGKHLPAYKNHQTIGIDTSLAMLEMARKQKGDFTLLQMSGEDLAFENQSFDYIVLSHVIAVVNDPEKVLEEVHRVLKPKGKVYILNHFTPNNWLRHIDRLFNSISGLFRFRSVFYIESLATIQKFRLLKAISFGKLSYFKLLIYTKA